MWKNKQRKKCTQINCWFKQFNYNNLFVRTEIHNNMFLHAVRTKSESFGGKENNKEKEKRTTKKKKLKR